MFDYYLFDLDGVIVDVEEEYRRAVFDEVEDRLGRSFSDDQIRNLWHGIGEDSRDEILRSWGYDEPRDFWDVFDEVDTVERRLEYTYAYDDAYSIEEIDAKKGVVTHSPPELAVPALEKAGLDHHFDTVVSCSYDIGFKPDPNPIQRCMSEIGAEPSSDADTESTVMVGDSTSDVKGAWNAGITASHIDRLGHPVEADINVESVDEIASLDAARISNSGDYQSSTTSPAFSTDL
ncbi:HAD family hydrolase [Halorutilales archaeon Cl-col2-1]